MTRALVIGKFYPPHRGHKFLIDTALANSDEVHVIVCDKPVEDPPAELRAAWIQEIHPKARVWRIDDRYDADDSAVWAKNCLELLGFRPEVVFTSEAYGNPFAQHLGCRHHLVDQSRIAVPISGTKVRTNPFECWDYLEPPVKGYYALRVVLIGAESTGKTTLATDLAKELQTIWLAEYGREYWEAKMARGEPNVWVTQEFVHIASEQCRREEQAARDANRVLICDTDAFATRVWHHRYMNHWSAEVDRIVFQHRMPDLYLLTDIATPFEQDGTRDGEFIRHDMHEVFRQHLLEYGRPFVEVCGNRTDRLLQAMAAIRKLLDQGRRSGVN